MTDVAFEFKVVMRGGIGTVNGVTGCVGVEADEESSALRGCTVNVYWELFSRPVTVQVVGAETAGASGEILVGRCAPSWRKE